MTEEDALWIQQELLILLQWLPGSEEYQMMEGKLEHHAYRHALDGLEHLIIQWMFELSKLGMSSVGTWCSQAFLGSMMTHGFHVT